VSVYSRSWNGSSDLDLPPRLALEQWKEGFKRKKKKSKVPSSHEDEERRERERGEDSF